MNKKKKPGAHFDNDENDMEKTTHIDRMFECVSVWKSERVSGWAEYIHDCKLSRMLG